MEGLSLHPYAFQAKGKDWEERVPSNPGDVETIRTKVKRNIRVARAALDDAGGENKQIWITELGWPVKMKNVTPNDKSHLPVTEEIQRDLLHSTFNMIKSHSGKALQSFDIANVFYYNVEDWIEKKNWAYRAGLREDADMKQKFGLEGKFRKAWFAFQGQAEFP